MSGIFWPTMNRRPVPDGARRLPSDSMPASAVTVTSGSRCAAWSAWIDGMIVVVSALLPSKTSTISGNPRASVNKPTAIRDTSHRCLLYPGSRNPSPASVSKQSVVDVVEHQRGWPQPHMTGARSCGTLMSLGCCVGRQATQDRVVRRRYPHPPHREPGSCRARWSAQSAGPAPTPGTPHHRHLPDPKPNWS